MRLVLKLAGKGQEEAIYDGYYYRNGWTSVVGLPKEIEVAPGWQMEVHRPGFFYYNANCGDQGGEINFKITPMDEVCDFVHGWASCNGNVTGQCRMDGVWYQFADGARHGLALPRPIPGAKVLIYHSEVPQAPYWAYDICTSQEQVDSGIRSANTVYCLEQAGVKTTFPCWAELGSEDDGTLIYVAPTVRVTYKDGQVIKIEPVTS